MESYKINPILWIAQTNMWNQWSSQSISKKLLTSTLPKAFKETKHPWQNRGLCAATWLVKRDNQKLGVNGQTCIVKEAYQWNTTAISSGICSSSHTCNWPGKVAEHWSNQVCRWYQFIHSSKDEGKWWRITGPYEIEWLDNGMVN